MHAGRLRRLNRGAFTPSGWLRCAVPRRFMKASPHFAARFTAGWEFTQAPRQPSIAFRDVSCMPLLCRATGKLTVRFGVYAIRSSAFFTARPHWSVHIMLEFSNFKSRGFLVNPRWIVLATLAAGFIKVTK